MHSVIIPLTESFQPPLGMTGRYLGSCLSRYLLWTHYMHEGDRKAGVRSARTGRMHVLFALLPELSKSPSFHWSFSFASEMAVIFLRGFPFVRLQNIWEICSRREFNVQTLHSKTSSQLAVGPQSRLEGFGDRSFSIAAPGLWNVLPGSITDCKSIGVY